MGRQTPSLIAPRLGLLGLGLLGSACFEAPSEEARAAEARAATAAAAAFEPLEAEAGRMLAEDGRISVPLPEFDANGDAGSSGWECIEDSHGQGRGRAVALRCRREDPGELLFFSAKTHRQPPAQRTDPETLLMSLYRADNEEFFATVDYRSNGPAILAGAHGWEAELVAEHPRLGTIRKRERLALVGDRVLALSAEGQPEHWERHAAAIEAWFNDVRFAR